MRLSRRQGYSSSQTNKNRFFRRRTGWHFLTALELSLELLYLWNIFRHRRPEKILVIPLGVLLDLIRGPFNLAVPLRLAKEVKVVAETLFVVLNTEQVIESGLGKGDRLVHRIQVIRIHRGHKLANQVETSRVGQSRALISQNFFGLVTVIIRLGAIRHDLFRVWKQESKRRGEYKMAKFRRLMAPLWNKTYLSSIRPENLRWCS